MERKKIEDKVKSLNEKGYSVYSLEGDKKIGTPTGSVYDASDLLSSSCPLCELYFQDNPNAKKVVCLHDEKDLLEIKEARSLASLLLELDKIDLRIIFKDKNIK